MPEHKIMLLGEAWGKEEEEEGLPFVGPSGRLLNSLLSHAGISRRECYVTNVFNLRPTPSNDVANLCGPKAEGITSRPPLNKGKYVHAKYAPELDRLDHELQTVRPNLVIAFGATAAWALLGTSGIRKIRGAPSIGRFGLKVLPTYHPAAVLRDWSLRPILLSDLDKARRHGEFPDLRRPQRFIHVEPTLRDLLDFEEEFIVPSDSLSIDVETIKDQITCIGFAPSIDRALVVPIYDPTKGDGNYWPSLDEELLVWEWIRRQCGRAKRIVGQNFLYDIHRLWRSYGITIPAACDDTMLLHHALQPELEKGLGFLGSVYTEEAAWKVERKDNQTLKKED